MRKPIVTFVLMIYIEGPNGYKLKNEYPVSDYKSEEEALCMAKLIASEYNKKGYDYAIFREVVEPIKYVLSNENLEYHM